MKFLKRILKDNNRKNNQNVFSLLSYKDQSMNDYIKSITNSVDDKYINAIFRNKK